MTGITLVCQRRSVLDPKTWVVGKSSKLVQLLLEAFGTNPNDIQFFPAFPLPPYSSILSQRGLSEKTIHRQYARFIDLLLKGERVKRILSFDRRFAAMLLQRHKVGMRPKVDASWATSDGKEYYLIYSLRLENGREIMVLDAPHYAEIDLSPDRLKHEKMGLTYALRSLALS